MEYITDFFNNLEEPIVTHEKVGEEWIMDSRRHLLFKSLMGRGVNVACVDEEGFESHFYLATNLTDLLARALPQRSKYSGQDSFVTITQSARLKHSLPVLVETVTAKVSPMSRWGRPSRIHVATNNVKISSSDMDMESLKKSMMGVTSFNIWRDGDEELAQEEVTAINMMLVMLQQG